MTFRRLAMYTLVCLAGVMEELFAADAMLYRAKESGRNRAEWAATVG